MNILISNDDGYFSRGMAVLKNVSRRYGAIRAVAPDRERSAASNSLTLDRPLDILRKDDETFAVTGTPTDCVYLAVNAMSDFRPDVVFSGINHGANLGDDTLYSGTVAAAMEGYMLGLPAVAFSIADKSDLYWDTAELAAEKFIPYFLALDLKFPILWNVNIPKARPDELKGFVFANLGRRLRRGNLTVETINPNGRKMWWIGALSKEAEANKTSDFYFNSQGYVTVTALTADFTNFSQMEQLRASAPDFPALGEAAESRGDDGAKRFPAPDPAPALAPKAPGAGSGRPRLARPASKAAGKTAGRRNKPNGVGGK